MYMDPSVSGWGVVVDCYEHDNGFLGSVRSGKNVFVHCKAGCWICFEMFGFAHNYNK
jgi:hypothetical protein